MRKINKFGIMILYMLSALSCNKYLDKKPNSSLVTPSSLSDIQAILDDDATMNQARTPSYGESSTDEFFITPAIFDKLAARNDGSVERYTWQYYPVSGTGNDWASCYLPVYNANLALDELDNIPRTSANAPSWDNVKGSALFFRSYYFLELLWNYAKVYDSSTADTDPGIVLRLTSDFNAPSERTDNEDCYSRVISDAKTALSLLPDYPLKPTRPSKGAAYGLLARCYLSMRDYNDALLYADSALQLNPQLMDYNGDSDIPDGLAGNSVFKSFNKEIVFYTEINKYVGIYGTNVYSRIDTALFSDYDNNDLRKTAYFGQNADGYKFFKGTYANINTFCFSGIATDELYLIRAECSIRKGNIQNGLDDLNTLLKTRWSVGTFVPYTATNQVDALNILLKEREKELVMRGMRWMDLKRLNKEGRNIILKRVEDGKAYILQPGAAMYALPIPDDIIQLTGIPQNNYN